MRVFLLPALALTAFGFSSAALAQDAAPARFPAPGQTLLSVTATERVEVQQDLLSASLRAEMEGTDPTILQNEINVLMQKAVEKAKAVSDVKTSTDGYYVYPYDPEPRNKADSTKPEKKWRGSQGITISGKNAQAVLTLAGELQAMGLIMGGLNYSLSPETTESTRDSLMEAALKKVSAKAERAGKALGKPQVELIEINVETNMPSYPQPMMMRAMAADGMMEKGAAPVAEPGMSEVTLSVAARALLK